MLIFAPSAFALVKHHPKRKTHARAKTVRKFATVHTTRRVLFGRDLKQGMQGNDVKRLQRYLTMVGIRTTADGQFGPGTTASVKTFERAHHLRADGVVSASVDKALKAALDARPKSKRARSSDGPVGRGTISHGLAAAPADAPAEIKEIIAAGNRIAFKPYCYGGGHGSFSDSCYDCSGSVSYALHGAPGRMSYPIDSTELESYGAAGRGRWISIYANSGHTYMYIAGLRFDTSAQGSTGGSRWTYAGRSSDGYVVRHPRGL